MFRFSIRELMLVTLVAGVLLGWGMDHRNHRVLREENEELRDANGDFAKLLKDAGYPVQLLCNSGGGYGILVRFPNGGGVKYARSSDFAIFNQQAAQDFPSIDYADYQQSH